MATAMSFVVSFFLTPFITNMLGTEAYGFVTLSKNFVSYAVIISTALDSYATRYIAMEYHSIYFFIIGSDALPAIPAITSKKLLG